MKISNIVLCMLWSAWLLFAQSRDNFLDIELLDVELGENQIVVCSDSSINWKSNNETEWQGEKLPLLAERTYWENNIVLGENGNFAARLELEKDNTVVFYENSLGGNGKISKEIPGNPERLLFGFDGFFDKESKQYYFAGGEAGIIVLSKDGGGTLKNTDVGVSIYSLSKNYRNHKYIALSGKGSIWGNVEDDLKEIAPLGFNPQKEEAIRLIRDSDTSVLILTSVDTLVIENDNENNFMYEKLYRWDGNIVGGKAFYIGGTDDLDDHISKITRSGEFIYILKSSGKFLILNEDGTPNDTRREEIMSVLAKTNVAQNYQLTDISVFENLLAFASNKGLFYSANNGNSFDFFPKDVKITSDLREVYAEPGIMTGNDNFSVFEYSIAQNDNITIDIFNYNLDFVCRIIENKPRQKATDDKHSTVRNEDRWDGTINNRGGRTVSPGVYYFKITAQKSKKSAVGKIVVAK